MSFFTNVNNLFKGGDKGGNKNGNHRLGGGNKSGFRGGGQSLGGSKPGKVIPIALPHPGTLGMKIEKRPGREGTAVVSQVVAGSQAEAAGLQRGDILCIAGTNGDEEMGYDLFLSLAKSHERPFVFDIRRIQTKAAATTADAGKGKQSADSYARKQAVIAAAEAREKAHKKKEKPMTKTHKDKLSSNNATTTAEQRQLMAERDEQLKTQQVPKTEEARRAMEQAKLEEAKHAAELGYNPYETNKMTSGQARNATVAVAHGNVGGETQASLPTVRPPTNPAQAVGDDTNTKTNDHHQQQTNDAMVLSQAPDFDEAYTTMVTSSPHATVLSSFGIMRKLVVNATTKGQNADDEEAAAKFRRVRLTNAKIQAAIVDVPGALELMMAFGFQLVEDGEESYLAFPAGGYQGPPWLAAALRQMERYESSTASS